MVLNHDVTLQRREITRGDVMMVTYGDPFEALFALQRALDARLASDWMGDATTAGGSYPPINIFQKGDDFVAVIELPGVNKADLQIEAKENTIRISGKKIINYDEVASIHRRERVSGSFDRTISIPIDIDPNGIRAEYREGVLALSIPRAESAKPRTIKIA
jgi:HSP20 family protein